MIALDYLIIGMITTSVWLVIAPLYRDENRTAIIFTCIFFWPIITPLLIFGLLMSYIVDPFCGLIVENTRKRS